MNPLSKFINNYFNMRDEAFFDELILPVCRARESGRHLQLPRAGDYAGINYEESYWTAKSSEFETVITYILPGVEKSQLSIRIEQEEQESVLVVEISKREGGGIGSKEKSSKFHFFPGEIPEKTSCELKDGVLSIRIPKEANSKVCKKTVLEIPLA